jgi:hypothetical protein
VCWYTPTIPSLFRRQRQENGEFKARLGKVKKTLSQKQNTNKKGVGSMAQAVEYLLSIQEALHLISSTTIKKN